MKYSWEERKRIMTTVISDHLISIIPSFPPEEVLKANVIMAITSKYGRNPDPEFLELSVLSKY